MYIFFFTDRNFFVQLEQKIAKICALECPLDVIYSRGLNLVVYIVSSSSDKVGVMARICFLNHVGEM